jgi:signal transduction histidine kinase
MTKKLLHKTLRAYLIFSVIVLLISAPLFYFMIEKLYIEDADEALFLRKNEFIQYTVPNVKQTDISIWNKMNRDVKIEEPTPSVFRDTIYYQHFYDTLYKENEPYRILNTPVTIEGKPYTFSARINLVETDDLIKSIARLFAFILLFLLTGLYFITKRLSIHLWKPFYQTLDAIEQFEIDKTMETDFSKTDIEEFERLNQAILKLINKNTAIYNSQREFIDNAAHELQTPLAVFQAHIDVLMQRSDITQGQSDILTELNASISRLNKLNKNLLLLSKIERNQYVLTENILINSIFDKQSAFFIEQAEAKNIAVKIDLLEQVSVKTNLVLAEILVSNLFLNAIQHNIQNGNIHITLSKQSLTFSNSGIKHPLSIDKLFQRFLKINPSSQGNGLGLSIVKKIADMNGWTVGYRYENDNHVFNIHF